MRKGGGSSCIAKALRSYEKFPPIHGRHSARNLFLSSSFSILVVPCVMMLMQGLLISVPGSLFQFLQLVTIYFSTWVLPLKTRLMLGSRVSGREHGRRYRTMTGRHVLHPHKGSLKDTLAATSSASKPGSSPPKAAGNRTKGKASKKPPDITPIPWRRRSWGRSREM